MTIGDGERSDSMITEKLGYPKFDRMMFWPPGRNGIVGLERHLLREGSRATCAGAGPSVAVRRVAVRRFAGCREA